MHDARVCLGMRITGPKGVIFGLKMHVQYRVRKEGIITSIAIPVGVVLGHWMQGCLEVAVPALAYMYVCHAGWISMSTSRAS